MLTAPLFSDCVYMRQLRIGCRVRWLPAVWTPLRSFLLFLTWAAECKTGFVCLAQRPSIIILHEQRKSNGHWRNRGLKLCGSRHKGVWELQRPSGIIRSLCLVCPLVHSGYWRDLDSMKRTWRAHSKLRKTLPSLLSGAYTLMKT